MGTSSNFPAQLSVFWNHCPLTMHRRPANPKFQPLIRLAQFMQLPPMTLAFVSVVLIMKKTLLLSIVAFLSLNVLAAGTSLSPADEKWLGVIEKMVSNGHNEISTPNAVRAELLRDWARKNGYTIQETKSVATIRIKLSKDIAKN